MPDQKTDIELDDPKPVADQVADRLQQVMARKSDGKAPLGSLSKAHLVGLDLEGVNLAGVDLSGADLSRCDLRGANLLGANLAGATFFEARLSAAELGGANLQGADLTRADLAGASLVQSDLAGAQLRGANLEGASLVGAQAQGANFELAQLVGARMEEACLQDASFARAKMKAVDLDRTDVTRCNFRAADLRDSRLAHLSGFRTANWIGVDMRGINFSGAHLLARHMRDENYLDEFRSQSATHRALYWFWWLTSDCGRSLLRWGVFTLSLVLAFAGAYLFVDMDFGANATDISPLYFSVVTMTTLGFGDALPKSEAAQWMTLLQVSLGYLMLGGLLSILSGKMARRAD